MRTDTINVYVRKEINAALKAQAAQEDRSVAWVLDRILSESLGVPRKSQ